MYKEKYVLLTEFGAPKLALVKFDTVEECSNNIMDKILPIHDDKKKRKVYIAEWTRKNDYLLPERFKIVRNPNDADFILASKTWYYANMVYSIEAERIKDLYPEITFPSDKEIIYFSEKTFNEYISKILKWNTVYKNCFITKMKYDIPMYDIELFNNIESNGTVITSDMILQYIRMYFFNESYKRCDNSTVTRLRSRSFEKEFIYNSIKSCNVKESLDALSVFFHYCYITDDLRGKMKTIYKIVSNSDSYLSPYADNKEINDWINKNPERECYRKILNELDAKRW